MIDRVGTGAVNKIQAADRHDREAKLHELLAAETDGCLYFGFLHAAEVHRAAARELRGDRPRT